MSITGDNRHGHPNGGPKGMLPNKREEAIANGCWRGMPAADAENADQLMKKVNGD